MKNKALYVCLVLLGSGLVACGKNMPASPVAPPLAIETTNAASASARITGQVGTGSGFGYSLMSTTSGAGTGITVTATGQSATTTTDASGRFQLSVRPGAVELHFTGSGIDSRTNLGAINAGDNVDVLINLSGSSADLQVTDRVSGNRREIEGRVNAVPPATASGTFRVGDRLINTNAETDFFLNGGNGSLQDVVVGTRARVTGPAGTTGLVAAEVNVQNDQAPGSGGGSGGGNDGTGGGGTGGGTGGGGSGSGSDTTTVTGPLSSVLGLCPALRLRVGATAVNTDANTQFDLSCLSLLTANGNATVTGTKNADGSIAAKVIRR